jgi:hypothetical protein
MTRTGDAYPSVLENREPSLTMTASSQKSCGSERLLNRAGDRIRRFV